MFANLTGWHFLAILIIILLLFGAPKLPALAKSLGQSMRILKGEMRTAKEESAASTPESAGRADSTVADPSPATRTTSDKPLAEGGESPDKP